MINAELLAKIKAEIERHLNSATEHQNANPDMPKYRWYLYEGEKELCTDLLDYIDDSLESEKSSEGLEEEIHKYNKERFDEYFPEQDGDFISEVDFMTCLNRVARHFAQWQKEQMLKDAVEAIISQCPGSNEIIFHNPITIHSWEFPWKFSAKGLNKGDKVKLIIVKED